MEHSAKSFADLVRRLCCDTNGFAFVVPSWSFSTQTATFKAGCENGRTSPPLSATASDSQQLRSPVEPRPRHAFHF